ncbi:MAG: hypothetical protein ABJN26_15665 [Stappiaceae bacterium]
MINVTKIAKTAALALVATTMAFSAVEIANPNPAEAASISKKAKTGTKAFGKGFKRLEKLGHEMGHVSQKSSGFSRAGGTVLRTVGRTGSRGTQGLTRATGALERQGTRMLTKTQPGRLIHRTHKRVSQGQTKLINKAFSKCRGKACKVGKGVVKFVLPF